MHRFNVSFTKSKAQLVEIELAGEAFLGVGKDVRTTAWVIPEEGPVEARLYGKYVVPTLFKPKLGFNEADALSALEELTRSAAPTTAPIRLIVIRCGELRGYVAMPIFVDTQTGEGLDEAYTLGLPALRVGSAAPSDAR